MKRSRHSRPRTAISVVIVSFALAALAACGDDGALDSDVPIAAATEEVFVAGGGASGEQWALFSRISALAFTMSRDLALLDAGRKRIVVVASDGSLRREIPRPGEGSAGLETPTSLVATDDGRLLAWDLGHRAFLVFDTAGAMTGRIQVESSGLGSLNGFGRVLRALPDGRMLATGRSGGGPGRPIEAYSSDGVRQTLYTAWEMPQTTDHASSDGTHADGDLGVGMRVGMREPPEFAPSLLVDVLPDGRVAVVDSVDYRVKLVSVSRVVEGTLERPIPPFEVTPEIRRAERSRMAEVVRNRRISVTGPGMSPEIREAIGRQILAGAMDRMTFADQIPVVSAMAVDSEGRVWVARSASDGHSEGPTDIFGADGRYVGTLAANGVRIPAAFGPGGLMAYVERDESGLPIVRVVRLLELGPP